MAIDSSIWLYQVSLTLLFEGGGAPKARPASSIHRIHLVFHLD
jgi:hypothetical protein